MLQMTLHLTRSSRLTEGYWIRFSIIKGNDNGCANISISLNLESMQVNLFDTIQTSRKIVYIFVFVTLTAFVDNVISFNLESQK
jgi:hypothetical protein